MEITSAFLVVSQEFDTPTLQPLSGFDDHKAVCSKLAWLQLPSEIEGCTFNQSAAYRHQIHAHSLEATTMILLRDEHISMDTERFLFLTTSCSHEEQPEPQHHTL